MQIKIIAYLEVKYATYEGDVVKRETALEIYLYTLEYNIVYGDVLMGSRSRSDINCGVRVGNLKVKCIGLIAPRLRSSSSRYRLHIYYIQL